MSIILHQTKLFHGNISTQHNISPSFYLSSYSLYSDETLQSVIDHLSGKARSICVKVWNLAARAAVMGGSDLSFCGRNDNYITKVSYANSLVSHCFAYCNLLLHNLQSGEAYKCYRPTRARIFSLAVQRKDSIFLYSICFQHCTIQQWLFLFRNLLRCT